MRKIVSITIVIILAMVQASCNCDDELVSGSGYLVETPTVAGSGFLVETPMETGSAYLVEAPTLNNTQSVESNEQSLTDISGYLSVGIKPRIQMEPGLDKYYYKFAYPNNEETIYDEDFDEEITKDIDGDGIIENIRISGRDSVYQVDNEAYSKITLDIDGKQLELSDSHSGTYFTLDGKIIDIKMNDSKLEIGIIAEGEQGWTGYIISCDQEGNPKIIFNDIIYTAGEFSNGTGFIQTWADDGVMPYQKLWILKDDRTGFDSVPLEYYTNPYQYYCWDYNGKWTEDNCVETQWDQELYLEIDGKDKVVISKGTKVYFGLYSDKKWLMILDPEGLFLGWLNVRKVDYMDYTGYMFDLGN